VTTKPSPDALQQTLRRLQERLSTLDDVALADVAALLNAAETLSAVLSEPADQPVEDFPGDAKLRESARTLLRSAVEIFLGLGDPGRMDAARRAPEHLEGHVKRAFVAVLNVMDFQYPSWKPVEPEHLNLGFEVTVGRQYILRGYAGFGGAVPDLRDYPQLPGRRE